MKKIALKIIYCLALVVINYFLNEFFVKNNLKIWWVLLIIFGLHTIAIILIFNFSKKTNSSIGSTIFVLILSIGSMVWTNLVMTKKKFISQLTPAEIENANQYKSSDLKFFELKNSQFNWDKCIKKINVEEDNENRSKKTYYAEYLVPFEYDKEILSTKNNLYWIWISVTNTKEYGLLKLAEDEANQTKTVILSEKQNNEIINEVNLITTKTGYKKALLFESIFIENPAYYDTWIIINLSIFLILSICITLFLQTK